jgi:rhamnosyl/mannosyltransferase
VPIGGPDRALSDCKTVVPVSIYPKINKKRIILSVGRLVSYKGFDVLIRAAKNISNDNVIVIVGSGPLHLDLLQDIKNSNLGERVVLAGRLNDSELNYLYKNASIFCLPSTSRAEAFGVVLLEAMSYGLPLVASCIHGSGVAWVNLHGVSGYNVPVGDAGALAEAFKKILSSEALQYKLRNGSRERYLAEFTEEVHLERIVFIYERLVSDFYY